MHVAKAISDIFISFTGAQMMAEMRGSSTHWVRRSRRSECMGMAQDVGRGTWGHGGGMDETGVDVSEVFEACRTCLDRHGYMPLGAGTRQGT